MVILDQEKGVDPMMSTCFYCGKTKNELMLVGVYGKRIRREAGASPNARELCFNKEPCDECKSIMEQGVIIISTADGETDTDNPHRTGGWCAITLDAARRMFNVDVEKQRVFFMEDSVYDKIGLPRDMDIDNRNKQECEEAVMCEETICCDNCGHEYDRHIGDECPNCGQDNSDQMEEKYG